MILKLHRTNQYYVIIPIWRNFKKLKTQIGNVYIRKLIGIFAMLKEQERDESCKLFPVLINSFEHIALYSQLWQFHAPSQGYHSKLDEVNCVLITLLHLISPGWLNALKLYVLTVVNKHLKPIFLGGWLKPLIFAFN